MAIEDLNTIDIKELLESLGLYKPLVTRGVITGSFFQLCDTVTNVQELEIKKELHTKKLCNAISHQTAPPGNFIKII